jgi:hypothetical protein
MAEVETTRANKQRDKQFDLVSMYNRQVLADGGCLVLGGARAGAPGVGN